MVVCCLSFVLSFVVGLLVGSFWFVGCWLRIDVLFRVLLFDV